MNAESVVCVSGGVVWFSDAESTPVPGVTDIEEVPDVESVPLDPPHADRASATAKLTAL